MNILPIKLRNDIDELLKHQPYVLLLEVYFFKPSKHFQNYDLHKMIL